MRFNILALTLATATAASADLYTLDFYGAADFVGPVNGQLTLDLDAFGHGSFLGTVGTNFGPATAEGTAVFGPLVFISGSIEGTLDFGPLGTYDLSLFFNPSLDGGLGEGFGTLTGFDPGAGEEVTGNIWVDGWSLTAVPAPGALALLGLAGLGRRRRA